MSDKKIGRPSTKNRKNKLSIRITDQHMEILESYCERENCSKTDAVERGIERLAPDIKE